MRHADHYRTHDFLRKVADVVLYVAGKYLVAEGFDDPLGPPREMNARGRPVAKIAGVEIAVARDGSRGGLGIVDVAGESLRSAKANMADLAVGERVAGQAVVAQRQADRAWVSGHVVAQAV